MVEVLPNPKHGNVFKEFFGFPKGLFKIAREFILYKILVGVYN